MLVVFGEGHAHHAPKAFMTRGQIGQCPEVPERAEAFLRAVQARGDEVEAPDDYGLAPISAIHSADYLAYLESAWREWQAIGGGAEVIPNVHPGRAPGAVPQSIVGRAGYFQADTACPIAEHTYTSALTATHAAVHAARRVHEGASATYALVRPPGHHAFADMAGGFCFMNNSAVAANWLTTKGLRVAIVDVDVHHGNGTQAIFYRRRDVLTVSLHGDPNHTYPYFWGYAHERGEGDGAGFNLNIPLSPRTEDTEYLVALEDAKASVRRFAPDVLIVALGLDAFVGDPLQCMRISTPGFGQIGAAIAGLSLPTVVIQEGGYPCAELGGNLSSFLDGFDAAHVRL
jgi:acetoin utilization deacetylase AcuC-like enzyme